MIETSSLLITLIMFTLLITEIRITVVYLDTVIYNGKYKWMKSVPTEDLGGINVKRKQYASISRLWNNGSWKWKKRSFL